MKAIDNYSAALYEIQAATLKEKIIWKRIQPNSFSYKIVNHDLEDLILNFKKIEINDKDEYLFSLTKRDFEDSEVLLNLDTSNTDPHLKDALEELYNFVEYHVDLKSLDGLRDFIDTVEKDSSGSIFD